MAKRSSKGCSFGCLVAIVIVVCAIGIVPILAMALVIFMFVGMAGVIAKAITGNG